ncbi:hypothetical protein HJG60_010762 [Phyllostomus discolor]|uniref:Uncharacterized protein n=1 Tax=Phyllostomus discolor TaxID=89673 RepID=A0A834ADT4_9CHIR|nr:hypothetical protein HJG60_010762 [Phyllostomus discolor]
MAFVSFRSSGIQSSCRLGVHSLGSAWVRVVLRRPELQGSVTAPLGCDLWLTARPHRRACAGLPAPRQASPRAAAHLTRRQAWEGPALGGRLFCRQAEMLIISSWPLCSVSDIDGTTQHSP